MQKRIFRAMLLIFVALSCAQARAADTKDVSAVDYRIVRSFEVPGAGGWDYLTYDADGGRLFIARSDRVQVVDPVDGRLTGEIFGTAGVHGVALAKDEGKGYTSNGRAASVTVFDLKTLAVLSTIATPGAKNPDFIAYDAGSHQVLAFNGGSDDASVIDAKTDTLVATVKLSGKPEAAVSDGRGRMYVNIENRNELLVLDMKKRAVVKHVPLAGCDEPAGLAIDPETRRLFVGCHNDAMLVIAIDSGKVLTSLPIGSGVDASAFDAAAHLVFTSQNYGTLTVVREVTADRFEVVQNATTAKDARTMALNPVDHEVYVVRADFDEIPSSDAGQPPRRVVRPGTFRLYVLAPR